MLGNSGSATLAMSLGKQAVSRGTALLVPGGTIQVPSGAVRLLHHHLESFHTFSCNPALCSLTRTQANLKCVPHHF